MTYPDFEARWKPAGGAERANYGLFLQDLCDLIGVARPDPTTDSPAQDAYVLERAVEFSDKRSTGRIDLYKRGCFVLETKQGTDTPDQQKAAERAELGLPAEKRRKGHARRAGEPLNAKEQTINQQGLASVVLSLHQQIDAAVADAYGWPHNLPDSEILTRLVQLNHQRAAEEAAGHIRYLRPDYQAPGRTATAVRS